MPPRKRLQVFVSSTFDDLKDERQAAVTAILTAGHIPAGMELFTAGDEEQMGVIRRWIDESDAYLLILGARYGSIEPASGKSYTHLEFDYAVSKGKPLFCVVIESKHMGKLKAEKLELSNGQKYQDFRRQVGGGRMVRFWSNVDQIKLAILESLNELARRDDLVGWVRADQAPTVQALEELARLSQENQLLRAERADLPEIMGVNYAQMLDLLKSTRFEHANILRDTVGETFVRLCHAAAGEAGLDRINLLHALVVISSGKSELVQNWSPVQELIRLGLLTRLDKHRIEVSTEGVKFLNRYRADALKAATIASPA